jgi:quercetin dioxygenase-like cupin family protein
VVRAGDGPTIHAERADYAATLLAAGSPQTRRDLYVMALEPGSSRQAEAHIPGSMEHVVVAAGRMRAGPADGPIELGAGDYASFRGDIPHVYEAIDPGTWAVLMMEHR